MYVTSTFPVFELQLVGICLVLDFPIVSPVAERGVEPRLAEGKPRSMAVLAEECGEREGGSEDLHVLVEVDDKGPAGRER